MNNRQRYFDDLFGKNQHDLYLAEMFPALLPEGAFESYLGFLRQKVKAELARIPKDHHITRQELESYLPISYPEFKELIKSRLLSEDLLRRLHRGTYRDYQEFLYRNLPRSVSNPWFTEPIQYALSYSDLQRHCVTCGSSGSGKSTFFMLLFAALYYRSKTFNLPQSGILVDPHGETVQALAKKRFWYQNEAISQKQKDKLELAKTNLKALELTDKSRHPVSKLFHPQNGQKYEQIVNELGGGFDPTANDRMILLDPGLDPTGINTPIINPLDIWDKNFTPTQKNHYTHQLVSSFCHMLGDEGTITLQMELVLRCYLSVLLNRKNSTLKDLRRFLNDAGGNNSDLLNLARQHPNEEVRSNFSKNGLFFTGSFTSTKNGLLTRLSSLLADRTFSNLLAGGRSTIDIQAVRDRQQFLLIDLSKLGEQSQKAAARLITGAIFASGQASVFSKKKQTPTTVIIDEAPLAISPAVSRMYVESRKHKINILTGFQVLGQGINLETEKIILGNSEVKIIGKTGSASKAKIQREIGCQDSDFQHLGQGVFLVASGEKPLTKVRFYSGLIGNKQSISSAEWEAVKQYQLNRYYRDLSSNEDIPAWSSSSSNDESHASTQHRQGGGRNRTKNPSNANQPHFHHQPSKHPQNPNCPTSQTGQTYHDSSKPASTQSLNTDTLNGNSNQQSNMKPKYEDEVF